MKHKYLWVVEREDEWGAWVFNGFDYTRNGARQIIKDNHFYEGFNPNKYRVVGYKRIGG